MTKTETIEYGTTVRNADRDGNGGFLAGIVYNADHGHFVALGGGTSKRFKSLAGAVNYMARLGYDPRGGRKGAAV